MEALLVNKIKNKEELEKAFAIRKKVFVEEQNCPPELEWEHEEESIHFLAEINGEACGACRWRKTDKGYKLERFAVLKEFRGKRIGQALVAAALADLPENAHYIYVHSQLDAMRMYSRFGFMAEGEQFEEAGIQHFKMVKKS
ncbi:putative GNAT family N-acyltransferase [Pedobacter sp. AK017]|uniref:GNAT family N-acetyltransferase n=1 Tax=Pedobacter sp. AK017 TaxID=2723073 RepID=UPI00160F4455|nr:GNAT family N-acetyltransferase [Pedobacter sp. AK017]MBB5436857.1 putative GNAT family N-acyltransferase [Pedobacter sp. AK017]